MFLKPGWHVPVVPRVELPLGPKDFLNLLDDLESGRKFGKQMHCKQNSTCYFGFS